MNDPMYADVPMEVAIERERLYREVWAEPLTKLAPKYHLSDNGLRKVCKALDVPLPVAGHWAKVAAGHRIEPPALPAECERKIFVSHRFIAIQRSRRCDVAGRTPRVRGGSWESDCR